MEPARDRARGAYFVKQTIRQFGLTILYASYAISCICSVVSTKAHHKTPEVTSALAPDLEVVSKFISEMLAKGAVTGLIAAILALLVRMRDLNTELMKKLAAKSQGHPPSETMRRLELEQLVRGKSADNAEQTAGAPPKAKRKKRGARAPKPHGRPIFPSHLPRVPRPLFVSSSKRQCPNCKRETARVCMKPIRITMAR